MQEPDKRAPEPSTSAAPVPQATDEAGGERINTVPLYSKRRFVIPAALVVLAGLAGAWYWYVNLRDFVSTDDAYIDQDRVSLSSKILGRVATLAVDEGDSVTKGQVLVTLDQHDLLAQKEQVEASLRFAQESVQLSHVHLARAQEDYVRAEAQFNAAVIPKEEFDHARNALDAARAEQRIALSRIGTARAQVGVVEAQLENGIIASPVTGTVAKRWILPGEVVQPGQPIFSIYDRTETWVTANLEETNLNAVRLGQHVDIAVDSYPDMSFSGEVFQLGTSTAAQFSLIPPNNASGNFTKITQRVPIKISVTQSLAPGQTPVELLPGMSVEVRIKVK